MPLTEQDDESYGSSGSEDTWRRRVVKYVSGHEGGFSSTNRNTDGEGLSYGIIQWTQRSGNLGRLLRAMQRQAPGKFAEVFGDDWQQLIEATWEPGVRRVAGVSIWKDPWLSRFRAAGAVPELREVQLGSAMYGEWMTGAIEAAAILGIDPKRSLMAMTMLYDRAVQQGAERVVKVAERVARYMDRSAPDRDKIEAFARSVTSSLYRSSTPESRMVRGNKYWKQVGDSWHLHSSTGLDLYAIVRGRIDHILRDPSLS